MTFNNPKQQRPLYEIAEEIRKDWRKKDGSPNVYFGAVPYLNAMFSCNDITENYSADTNKSVVLYFLANAGTWRGEVARRVKKELKDMSS